MVLRLLLPAVDVEFLPLVAYGGVGGGASSDCAPSEPIVDDRPRSPRRTAGALTWGEEREERTDLVESFRNSEASAGEARFAEGIVWAGCEGEGTSGVRTSWSPSR